VKLSALIGKERLRHAWRGIGIMLRDEPNAPVHAVFTALVIAAGLVLGIGKPEWIAVIVAIMAVWVAEGFNTSIERIGDAVSPEHDPLIGKAKDVAAGAVLLAAIGAAMIGLLVFGPYLVQLFS